MTCRGSGRQQQQSPVPLIEVVDKNPFTTNRYKKTSRARAFQPRHTGVEVFRPHTCFDVTKISVRVDLAAWWLCHFSRSSCANRCSGPLEEPNTQGTQAQSASPSENAVTYDIAAEHFCKGGVRLLLVIFDLNRDSFLIKTSSQSMFRLIATKLLGFLLLRTSFVRTVCMARRRGRILLQSTKHNACQMDACYTAAFNSRGCASCSANTTTGTRN